MSFGIGAFPFGIFASTLNFNDGRPGPGIVFCKTINRLTQFFFKKLSKQLKM